MSQFIEINGKIEPIKITPKELEIESYKTHIRRGAPLKYTTFRSNAILFIVRFCEIYEVKFFTSKVKKPGYFMVLLDIPAMDIHIESRGNSFRNAQRRLVFKLHRAYSRKIFNPNTK